MCFRVKTHLLTVSDASISFSQQGSTKELSPTENDFIDYLLYSSKDGTEVITF